MAGPWEQYQSAAPAAGPWTQYQAAPQAAPASAGNSNPQEWMDSSGNVQTGVQAKPVDLGPAQTSMSAQGTGVGAALNNAESKMESFVGGSPDDKVRDTILSPERGALHMAQGVVEGSPGRVVKGALEAATVPSMFMGPESGAAGKVGDALDVAESAATKAGRKAMTTQSVVNVLSDVAERSGLNKLQSTDTRAAFAELGGQFKQRATAVYQAVDKAVDGELQPVLDKIDDLRKAVKANKQLDPDKAAAMGEQLLELGQRKAELVAKAAQSGVSDAVQAIKTADRDWSQFKNLERVGQRMKTAAGEVVEGSMLNPKKFATAVDAVENKAQLIKALGREGAEALKDVAKESLTREGRAEMWNSVGKQILSGTAKGLGIGAGAGIGYGVYSALSGK